MWKKVENLNCGSIQTVLDGGAGWKIGGKAPDERCLITVLGESEGGLMDKYRCMRDFYIEKYDEDGFPTDKYFLIPKDSIWELSTGRLAITISPCVRIERVWKSRMAKTRPWIEITPEHLEQFFEKVEVEE